MKKLHYSGLELRNIENLEKLKNLECLTLNGSEYINKIDNLENLKKLILSYNPIEDETGLDLLKNVEFRFD